MCETRTRSERDHSLLTPDTFVRAALPGMRKAVAIVHAAPAQGAGFTEYTVEFDTGGSFETGANQMFLYVLAGDVAVGTHTLKPGQYAYVPAASALAIRSVQSARAIAIESLIGRSASRPPPSSSATNTRSIPFR